MSSCSAVIPDADLAQLVERPSHTRNVVSSSLTVGKTSLIRPRRSGATRNTPKQTIIYKHPRVTFIYIYITRYTVRALIII